MDGVPPRSALDGRHRRGMVGTEARLDHTFGDHRRDQTQHQQRDGAEVVVMEDGDGMATGLRDCLVGNLGEHRIRRLDDQVDGEGAAYSREAGGYTDERMPLAAPAPGRLII